MITTASLRLQVSRSDWRTLCLVTALIAAIVLFQITNPEKSATYDPRVSTAAGVEARSDAALQQAAAVALGEREGAILIVDPQTGRLRTVLNPELAFEHAYAPGSTIKPFIALAALRSGVIKPYSRTLCREKYVHAEFQTVCSHPQHLPPLDPSAAIAYSCNYYFGTLGERLNGSQVKATLQAFGFGTKTDINANDEYAGTLGHGDWKPQNALGEERYTQVTPIQLLMGYAALVNGGHLLTPGIASADQFPRQERSEIQLADEEREVILSGLRNAVTVGTAARSGLNSLPIIVLGKTGTSMPEKGFRTQGWFVGFAGSATDYAHPTLGVLVFLKRGNGAEASAVSRAIFEEYIRITEHPETVSEDTEQAATNLAKQPSDSTVVRVHLAGENKTIIVPLEEYVAHVVSTEGSFETNSEALKALAVASRTYALVNLGRHQATGYDFCTTTHCQRFSNLTDVGERTRTAVKETEGEVLRDRQGKLVESYFSASCGGETANIASLWGVRPQPQLRGVVDEFCRTMPHAHWTDVISAADLLRATRSDSRTDVGGQLNDIAIVRRDETGRAELLSLSGEKKRIVRGWDFKIIVGRALGWNLLKSTRFRVSRSGTNFVFQGSGFGHGLGLCQEGAHVMSDQGSSYKQILSKYFPDSVVSRTQRPSADIFWKPFYKLRETTNDQRRLNRGVRLQMTSEHFQIDFPSTLSRKDADFLLHLLEISRSELLRRAGLGTGFPLQKIELYVNETTGDFVGRTGLPSWAAAASRGNRIELQPVALLRHRGVLETTLRHELVHQLVERLGNGQTPRWLAEGLAIFVAGEGPMISKHEQSIKLPVEELEQKLGGQRNSSEMRQLYTAAFLEVRRLIMTRGEREVWRRVASHDYAR